MAPDLPGLIEGLRAFGGLLYHMPIDAPGAVDAITVASIWGAIADVAGEVLALRERADNGR